MKPGYLFARILCTGSALFVAVPATAAVDACTQTTKLSGGSSYTTDGLGNESGDSHHELWHDGSGSMKMTVYGKNAAFKAEWNNAGDFLARTGLKWNETQTWDKYGTTAADFNFTKSGTGGSYSFIGIYGWSTSPLVEYYIVENGFWSTPPNAKSIAGTSKGTITVDGATYDIYTADRVDKPSIKGNTTFKQFWSIRRTPRTCGHISISDHWKKWSSLGMTLGKMYEAKILVEAGGGQGSFDLTYATVQANITNTSVLPDPETKVGSAQWNTGKAGTLSLVGLDGSDVRTVSQPKGSVTEIVTTDVPKGLYLVRFQAAGEAPLTRKLLIR